MEQKKIRIDEKIYKTIKLMLKGGASHEEIREFKPISYETMRRIDRTDSYQGYLELQRRYLANRDRNRILKQEQDESKPEDKPEDKPEETPETVLTDDRQKGGTISANYQVSRIYELLKQQNETLTLISNKLAFIVDELTK